MNAHNSLLDNFSNMHDEFNSSNNRSMRGIEELLVNEISDLEDSLNYFNGEYLVIDKRELKEKIKELQGKLSLVKEAHILKYYKNFNKEIGALKQSMCSFFDMKLVKGDSSKKKMCGEVKKTFDKMCDFNFIVLEEDLDTVIYDFKVDFEMKYIRDEYCKDDFNKIMRSFEHSLFEGLRSKTAYSVMDKQEIFRRHTTFAYQIIDGYRNKRKM